MSNIVSVVIPVHQPVLSHYEEISIIQCSRVLGNHPIHILYPEGMEISAYQRISDKFRYVPVTPTWLSSLLAYNKLKLSQYFHQLFGDYKYLLTYEPDAFVFRDALIEWCNKGYDYIGAPWFAGYSEEEDTFLGVGNSGFSLRNIAVSRQVSKNIFYEDPAYYQTGKINLAKAYLKRPLHWLKNQGNENFTLQTSTFLQEDITISNALQARGHRIAPVEEALKFSFETRPRYLFQLTNAQLPMGCHAWWKYDLSFWKPFIEKEGFIL